MQASGRNAELDGMRAADRVQMRNRKNNMVKRNIGLWRMPMEL